MFIAYCKSSAFDNLSFIEERKMGEAFFFWKGEGCICKVHPSGLNVHSTGYISNDVFKG